MDNTTNGTNLVVSLANATPTRVKQVKTILRGAKKVVAASGLIRYADALNKYRKPVSPANPNAVRFGALGALSHVTRRTKAAQESYSLALEVLAQEIQSVSAYPSFTNNPSFVVADFTDWQAESVADVTAMFDRAISFFA